MEEKFNIDIQVTGLGDLKRQLKEAKDEVIALSNAEVIDPNKLQEATKRAGALKDALSDANEQIAVMSGGSDFEKIASGIGLVSSQLANLDFEGASKSAKQLTANIQAMDPKKLQAEFGSFIKTIGQLSSAFVQMGLKLLANPLFLLVAIIGGIVIAIVMLKDKLKIAEIAFDMMTKPIKLVIQLLKDLGDWMGLTAFAAEESADRQVAANNKIAASSKEVTNNRVAAIDREIKLAKAAGKETEDLEKKKQDIIIQGSQDQLKTARSTYAELDAINKNGKSKLTEDQLKQFQEAAKIIKEEKENIKNAQTDKEAIVLESEKERNDKQNKLAEEQSTKEKERAKQKAADLQREKDSLKKLEEKYIDDIKSLQAKTDEEKLALQKSRDQRELDNIKLSKQAKIKAQKELDEKYAILEEQLEQTKLDKLKSITEQYNKDIVLIKDKSKQAQLAQEETDKLAEIDRITKNEEDKEAAKAAVREKYALLKREADAADFETENAKEIAKTEEASMRFEERYAILDEQQKALNANTTLNEEERKRVEAELAKARISIAQAEKQAKIATLNEIGSALGAFSELAGKETVAGKALAIAQATISAYTGIANVWGAPSPYPEPYGTAIKIASTAAVAASAFANIKKIVSVKVPTKNGGGGGAGTSGPSAPSTGASAPVTPTTQLTGNVSNFNETRQGQAVEAISQPTFTVRAIVSETEMTDAQSRVSRMQRSAEL
jgi:hypothetical protein